MSGTMTPSPGPWGYIALIGLCLFIATIYAYNTGGLC